MLFAMPKQNFLDHTTEIKAFLKCYHFLSPAYLEVGNSAEINTDILNSYTELFDFDSVRMTAQKDLWKGFWPIPLHVHT